MQRHATSTHIHTCHTLHTVNIHYSSHTCANTHVCTHIHVHYSHSSHMHTHMYTHITITNAHTNEHTHVTHCTQCIQTYIIYHTQPTNTLVHTSCIYHSMWLTNTLSLSHTHTHTHTYTHTHTLHTAGSLQGLPLPYEDWQ